MLPVVEGCKGRAKSSGLSTRESSSCCPPPLARPLQPTSMTVAHGYVAAGGQNSQLDARRLGGGDIVYKGHCGGSVNNALHIGRDASQQVGLGGLSSSP